MTATATPLEVTASSDADYARLGLARRDIQAWEDGARTDDRPGTYEWWYFDRPWERQRLPVSPHGSTPVLLTRQSSAVIDVLASPVADYSAMRKDLALAGSVLGPEASILSLSARTRQLVDGAARDFPDEDISALLRRYRRSVAPGVATWSASLEVDASPS